MPKASWSTGLTARHRLCLVLLMLLLSGCIEVRFYDGAVDQESFEINKLPRATESPHTFIPPTMLPTQPIIVPEVSPTTILSPAIIPTKPVITSVDQLEIKPGTWYYIAVTRQNRTMTLYVDGLAVDTSDDFPQNLDAPISLKIGRREGTQGFYLNGRVDEVGIYKGISLAAEQISRLYTSGEIGKCLRPSNGLCIPIPAGLTSFWPGDGTAQDRVTGYNSILKGGMTNGPGVVDQAFVLDGKDDYLEVPDEPGLNFGRGDFTLNLWANFNNITGEQVLMEKWIQDEPQGHPIAQGWTLTKLNNQALLLAMADGAGAEWGVSSKVLDLRPNTWNLFSATRQGQTVTLYMNGVLIATANKQLVNLDTPSTLKLGRREGGQGFFLNGRLDEVEIYNGTALTAEQIRVLYTSGWIGKCIGASKWPCIVEPAGLTSWWPGDIAAMEFIAGRNGSIKGASIGPGMVDQAFVLDGKDDYIEIPDDPALNFGTGDFTFDVWVNFDDISTNQVVMEKWIQEEAQEHPYSQGWTLQLINRELSLCMDDGTGESDWSLHLPKKSP